MAESFKYEGGGVNELTAFFPDIPWKADGAGTVFVTNEKTGEDQEVTEGAYVVKIADRYEVTDTEPAKAKPAEPVEVEEDPEPEAEEPKAKK